MTAAKVERGRVGRTKGVCWSGRGGAGGAKVFAEGEKLIRRKKRIGFLCSACDVCQETRKINPIVLVIFSSFCRLHFKVAYNFSLETKLFVSSKVGDSLCCRWLGHEIDVTISARLTPRRGIRVIN
jgi:hypothetical protein